MVRWLVLVSLLIQPDVAYAGVIGEAFKPGQPGFALILLLSISALCGFASFLFDALQFSGGKYLRIGGKLSAALIVLDLMFKVLRKGLEILTL